MKLTVASITLACAVSIAGITASQAASCNTLANNCVRNGGTQADCHAVRRIADCNKTGLYTSPSGRVWNADAKCVGGDCAGYKGKR